MFGVLIAKISSIEDFVAQITAPDTYSLRHNAGILLDNQIVVCLMIPPSGGSGTQ